MISNVISSILHVLQQRSFGRGTMALDLSLIIGQIQLRDCRQSIITNEQNLPAPPAPSDMAITSILIMSERLIVSNSSSSMPRPRRR